MKRKNKLIFGLILSLGLLIFPMDIITASTNEEYEIFFVSPENAIYINNSKIIPFFVPLVLWGALFVELDTSPVDIHSHCLFIEIYGFISSS